MARYFAELMLGQAKPFVFKDSLLGVTFDALEKLATKYFDKKIPVLFSGEDMDALVGFINKTKASVGFVKSRGVLQFSLYFD